MQRKLGLTVQQQQGYRIEGMRMRITSVTMLVWEVRVYEYSIHVEGERGDDRLKRLQAVTTL